MAESTTKVQCNDLRCLYALSEECDCHQCGGALHGSGANNMADPIWVKKVERSSKTRRAFRKYLNEQDPKSGTRLYRRHREEFNKQYAEWTGKAEPVVSIHSQGMGSTANVTVIKDQQHNGDTYSHVRRSNGKTEYRKNDKLITKTQIPEELGW